MGIVSLMRTICCWKKCRRNRVLILCTGINCVVFTFYLLQLQTLQSHRKPQKISAAIKPTIATLLTSTKQVSSLTATTLTATTFAATTAKGTRKLSRSTLVPTTPPVYWPDFRFKLVAPFIEPVFPKIPKYFLLVFVISNGEKHFLRRQTVRKTWGNNTCRQTPCTHDWKVVFALGKASSKSLDYQVAQEAKQHNDILIGNFEDIYFHLVIKGFMSYVWASSLNCRYILKADDDVYMRVPQLVAWLKTKAGQPSRFYGGHVHRGMGVGRLKGHKWCISRAYYDKDVWPPFCSGAFHVISSDLVPAMVNHTRVRRPFQMEDAYIGVVLSDLGITAVDIPGFDGYYSQRNPGLCSSNDVKSKVPALVAIGHDIPPSCMNGIHEAFSTVTHHVNTTHN